MNEVKLQNREHAAYLLSEKLMTHKNTNSIVIAIPKGGAPVGSRVAKLLNLEFDLMPCHRMMHPGNSAKTIGSISVDDVYIHEDVESIPQHYVYHQINILKNLVHNEINIYNSIKISSNLENKTVILVDDVLTNRDAMLAALRSIRKQNPLKIIVAVPYITAEAETLFEEEANNLIYLRKVQVNSSAHDLYIDFPDVSVEDVKDMLVQSESLRLLSNSQRCP